MGNQTDNGRFAPGIMELVPEALASTRPPARAPSLRADQSPMRGNGLKVFEGERLLEACRSPMLANQYQRWKDARSSGMPLLRDVYASVEEADLDDAMLLLQQGGDFIYVFQGSGSVQRYGRVFRGAVLSDIQGTLTEPLRALYNKAISSGTPIYIQFTSEFSANHISWERILLPVFGDRKGASRFILMYSAPLDDKFDILTAVFERSPIGMIATSLSGAANLDQARILMINARARDVLQLPSGSRPIANVHELKGWIAEVPKWTQVSTSTAGERTKIVYADPHGRTYVMLVELLGHFAVLHVIDMDGTH